MPMIFSEGSTARAIEGPRAEPTTVAAATPAPVCLRNSRRVNWFDGTSLFIERLLDFDDAHWTMNPPLTPPRRGTDTARTNRCSLLGRGRGWVCSWSMAVLRSSRSSELRRNLWTFGSCFEYSARRNCPREEVRLV